MSDVVIESIEILESAIPVRDLERDRLSGTVRYAPGKVLQQYNAGYRITTNTGVVGEYVGTERTGVTQARIYANALIGHDPLDREGIYALARSRLRKLDRVGVGGIDIALWDFAGKHYAAPIYELLGSTARPIPCYASTMAGDRCGGLDSPRAYADFAVWCKQRGYTGYKMHIWDDYDLAELIATIVAVRDAVGDDLALMLDPASGLRTFADALRVGSACDEANFLWLEDPYSDTSVTVLGHQRLRERVRTPLLLTEHVRGPEQHLNLALSGATDFLRATAEYDGGITGVLRIARAAETVGLDVELNAPGPMHRHLCAAIANTNFYEMCVVHPKTAEIGRAQEIYLNGYRDALEAVDDAGCVLPPSEPGLGIVYNWELLRKHAIASHVVTGG